MKGCTLLAGLFVLALATPAVASPCAGGDDSDSGSSSGSSSGSDSSSSDSSSSDSSSSSDYDSSSDYSSDDSSSSTETPACANTTDIVGRAQCQRFGGWDRQLHVPLRFTFAATGGSVSVAGMDFDGRASHAEVHNYHYPTEPTVRNRLETIALGGFEMQATGFANDNLHFGFHSGFAFGSSEAGDKQFGDLILRPQSVLQVSNAGIVGLSVPMGSWSLRSEALIGLRSTNLDMETHYGDCVDYSSTWNHEWLVEPRVGVEKWINPWLSAGIMVGSDLMQSGDLSMAIGITGHTAPRDNARVVGLGR